MPQGGAFSFFKLIPFPEYVGRMIGWAFLTVLLALAYGAGYATRAFVSARRRKKRSWNI